MFYTGGVYPLFRFQNGKLMRVQYCPTATNIKFLRQGQFMATKTNSTYIHIGLVKMRRYASIAIIFFVAVMFTTATHAINLPKSNPIPGGISIVKLTEKSSHAPKVHFNDKQVMVVADPKKPGHWLAVVGIPLDTEVGKQQLVIQYEMEKQNLSFAVKKHKYKAQYIKMKNKRKVNPYKKDLDRIIKEKKLSLAALQHWSDTPSLGESMILPVTGRLSSPFGLRRFFNKQPRKPHSGIDIAAPHGTPIVSPLAGKIIRTGRYFFNGNTIFIDHGQGLVTMYCHMSKIKVKAGQAVKQGQIIGAIGKTGRVTGPHLHWSISLNDARVDPSLFYTNMKRALKKPNKSRR